MGFIPLPQLNENVRVGPPGSRASDKPFGGDVGRATEQLGANIIQAGATIAQTFGQIGKKEKAQRDALDTANALGKSFTPQFNEVTNAQTDPTGASLAPDMDKAWEEHRKSVLDEAEKKGASRDALANIELGLARQKAAYNEDVAKNASNMKAADDVLSSTKVLDGLLNDITLHGATSKDAYERTVYAASEVIDAWSGKTVNERKEALINFKNKAAKARFDTLREAVRTPAQAQALQADLDTPYWRDQLTPTDKQAEMDQLRVQSDRWTELGIGTTADENINKTLVKPEGYTENTKKGLDAIVALPVSTPEEQARKDQHILDYRSNQASAYFEGMASKPGLTVKDIQKLRDDVKSDKWLGEFTQQGLENTLNSLSKHENAINQNIKSQEVENRRSYTKAFNLQKARLVSNVQDAMRINNASELLNPEQWQALREGEIALTALMKGADETADLPPNLISDINKIFDQQNVLRGNKHLAPLEQIKNKRADEITSKARAAVVVEEPPASGSGKGKLTVVKTGGGGAWEPALQKINASRFGQAAVTHLDPTLGERFNSLYEAAPPSVQKLLVIRSGWRDPSDPKMAAAHRRNPKYVANPRTSYHGKGGAIDLGFKGYRFGDAPPEAIKWLHDHAGEHGLVFPLDGSGNLPNEPWHIETIENRRGGGRASSASAGRPGGGGRGGGFYNALSGFEASGANAPHSYATTSSGMARGYFQITDGTWKDFGGLATGYKTAYDAPYEIQKQIADKIPMNRWAPETLNKMQKAGWTIYPTKTLAENAALNGDDGSGAPGDGGGGGGGGGDTTSGATSVFDSSAFNRAEAYDNLIKKTTDALDTDPMRHSVAQGVITDSTLLGKGQEAWDQRKDDYTKTQGYFGLRGEKQNKPFFAEEAAAYTDLLNSDRSADKIAFYKMMDSWPTEMKKDGYRQLAQTSPVGAAIGQLSADNAQLAMQGDGMLKGVEAGKGGGAAWQADANKGFLDAMGNSITGMNPNEIEGKHRVYDSIYAAKFGVQGELKPEQYEAIIENVENVKFGTVNGVRVMNPQGVTGRVMEAALTGIDYTAVSVYGTEPKVWNAQHTALILPSDVDKSLWQPKRVEPGIYMFTNSRGEIVTTITNKGPKAYYARLDAMTITQAAARATEAAAAERRGGPAGPVPVSRQDSPALQQYGQDIESEINAQTGVITGSGSAESSMGISQTLEAWKPGIEPPAPGTPTPIEQGKATEAPATRAVQPDTRTGLKTELTQDEKRLLETSVELYSQSLKNSGRSKEYVDKAIKEYREYYFNRADVLRRATILMRMQQGAPQ